MRKLTNYTNGTGNKKMKIVMNYTPYFWYKDIFESNETRVQKTY